jgi:predicted ester cyclase
VVISSGEVLVRRWVDVFNGQDLDACQAIGADAYVEHAVAPFGVGAPGAVEGPAHLRESASWLLAQFPDIRMTIVALIGEGDLIAVRLRTQGTNRGPLNGVMPPTGRSFEAEQSHWFRIENGRLAEHWATRDDLSTMLQLGVIAGPGPSDR